MKLLTISILTLISSCVTIIPKPAPPRAGDPPNVWVIKGVTI
jgi:hypothetical protein